MKFFKQLCHCCGHSGWSSLELAQNLCLPPMHVALKSTTHLCACTKSAASATVDQQFCCLALQRGSRALTEGEDWDTEDPRWNSSSPSISRHLPVHLVVFLSRAGKLFEGTVGANDLLRGVIGIVGWWQPCHHPQSFQAQCRRSVLS